MSQPSAPTPYRSTPVFDEVTLPAALRREHRTKSGVWGVVRVLEGELRLSFLDPPRVLILSPGTPGLLLPDEPHFVEPVGKVRMQVEFYDRPPEF
ncbi:MAG TPA: DUF1971 domain-containing protein [Allosphingosinicella sp.]